MKRDKKAHEGDYLTDFYYPNGGYVESKATLPEDVLSGRTRGKIWWSCHPLSFSNPSWTWP